MLNTQNNFDPSLYVRLPRMDVPSAVTVCRQMLTALPKTLPAGLKKHVHTVHDSLSELELLWQNRTQEQRNSDMKFIDQSADLAWGRLFRRLENYATLPADLYPLADRAQELLARIFPERLGFLKLDYASQWSESERRLNAIRDEKLSADLDRVCGSEFLKEVQRCHVLYGEMLGVTKPKQAVKEMPTLVPALQQTLEALSILSVQLTALYLGGDEETQAWVREVLRPIDDYRANASRRRAKGEKNASSDADAKDPSVP